jgi:hypothetical protein
MISGKENGAHQENARPLLWADPFPIPSAHVIEFTSSNMLNMTKHFLTYMSIAAYISLANNYIL